MNKVNKSYWRQITKRYCFSAAKVREANEYLINNAKHWRIVTITIKNTGSKYYIIEGLVDGKWKFLKGTDVLYSTPTNHWFRDYENAYNRCKKLARKFPEIKIKDLMCYSGIASFKYAATGYKDNVELKELGYV